MELKRMMEKLEQAKTHLELKKMIAEVDTTNSGWYSKKLSVLRCLKEELKLITVAELYKPAFHDNECFYYSCRNNFVYRISDNDARKEIKCSEIVSIRYMRFDKNKNKNQKQQMSHAGYFRSNDHLVFEGDGEYPLFLFSYPSLPRPCSCTCISVTR